MTEGIANAKYGPETAKQDTGSRPPATVFSNRLPYPASIEKVSNGYICRIGCQTYVHEGRAETGVKKLVEYFEKFEK